jgi:hypothetical protein
MKDLEIHLSIQTTEPLAGTATAGRQEPLRFEGWLELLRVISALIGAGGDPKPCAGSGEAGPGGG